MNDMICGHSIRDYQREMSKLPGITKAQAKNAARRLEKELAAAEAKAKRPKPVK